MILGCWRSGAPLRNNSGERVTPADRNALIRAISACACAAVVILATPRQANAACREVFFSCNLGDKEPDGTPLWRSANLRSLHSGGRSDAWIAKRCKVAMADPDGCNWRGGGGAVSSSGTIVLNNSYSAPAPAPAPTAAPAGAKRDAWGKRSPTPAPRADLPASPIADDGPYGAEIAQAAQRYKLPPLLIRAVMQVESSGNADIVSHKGAVGLMQLLPATARALGVDDIRDPAQNIMGGARFLRVLANKFDGDLVKVLSGYHAGSMRVVARDATPFAATDDYVRKILKIYYQLRDAALRGSEPG